MTGCRSVGGSGNQRQLACRLAGFDPLLRPRGVGQRPGFGRQRAQLPVLEPGEHGYPDGALNLFLPLNTIKAFPEDEVVWKSDYVKRDGADVWENVVEFEKRVGKRGQLLLAEVSIIPQARIGLSKRGHVALNIGVEIPVNETDFDQGREGSPATSATL